MHLEDILVFLLKLSCNRFECSKAILCDQKGFSIRERRSPLAREILLCEQRQADHKRVPKNHYIFECPWNLV